MKPFKHKPVFTHCSRIVTKPSLTWWRISNVMPSHLHAQVLKVEKWQEMIWMPLLHPSEESVEREGKRDFSDPSASRESLTRFPYENWISSSIHPSFLPLLLCGSEYLCIRGGDRSTGRGKRDRGISLIWGTSGLGASLDTYFSDHTPLLLASFGLHSYLNANIISTPI